MAENQDGQEKTENASGKKLTEARDRGQISKSVDVTTAAVILFGGMTLFTLGGGIISDYKSFMSDMLHNSYAITLTEHNVPYYFSELTLLLAKLLLPLLGVITAIILAAEISQVGFHFATKKFTEGMRWGQIFNPMPGIKRVFFSSHSYFELLKSILKLSLIGLVVWNALSGKEEKLLDLAGKPFLEFAAFMKDIAFELFWKVGLAYIVIAAGDLFYQKWKYKQDMKMTKREVKDESKQSEGDPQVKSRIRGLMRARFKAILAKNVPKADVIVTNPTHFAVAIAYKAGEMSAPKVVAKGADFLALKIREIAAAHGIPIVEEPPLARALYAGCDIDREIPEEHFRAVAKILAYVYGLKKGA